ncbi:MAG: 50S ribosomal protein L20 [bacterium]
MVRVKRGVSANKRRKNLLDVTKGFQHGRKSKFRLAKEAAYHALRYATRDRRAKKRVFRASWQVTVNAAVRDYGISYSKFIKQLKDKKVTINRKILAEIATNNHDLFAKIVEAVK